jgi:hypothetical protein
MSIAIADTIEFFVSINGSPISGLLHASLATTNCFSADTFSLTFSIDRYPPGDIAFWSSISAAYLEISASTPNRPSDSFFVSGMIDTVLVDPINRTVAIEGRDLSSLMIDSYRQQDFVNQTASEVVSTIARHHSLNAFVASTLGSVGRYFSDGYTKLSLGQFSRIRSDWDLLVQLARENDFDVFVEGRSLYFQPARDAISSLIPISIRQVQRLRVERNLGINSNPGVKVQSWNSQNMVSYDGSALGDGTATAGDLSPGSAPPFLFSASNFTSQQVEDSAGRYSTELGRLATVLNIDMPWDVTYSPRQSILLNGTESIFDTAYRIDSIERHYSSTSGSFQSIRATRI